MSLIERASKEMSELQPFRRAKNAPAAEAVVPVTGRRFDIDFDFLASQGFYTPGGDRPQSLALEMRAIKRKLLKRLRFYKLEREKMRAQRKVDEQRNVVMVTSTRPAEGKTFVAINLALSLAIEDQIDVLLVDADAPRPKVLNHFGLPGGRGLTDRLIDTSLKLDDLVLRANDAPLSILPEGSQTTGATELYALEEMARLVDDMSANQERLVIIDAPPVLATTEAVMLAKHVDEIVFVVEASSTPEPAVATALEDIMDSNPNVSLVLNKCLVQNAAKQYGAYYGYYHRGEEKAGAQGAAALQSDRE